MKTLDAVVLVHDGPIAKAYLWTLADCGYRPRDMVLMVPDKGGVPLPARLRARYLRFRQDLANNHWPRVLYGTQAALVAEMTEKLGRLEPRAADALRAITGRASYERSSESFEALLVSGWKDPALALRLRTSPAPIVLYTGGGVVPAALLESAGKPFLHIHPAVLPDVRGADGLLWTTLLGRAPGATALHLRPGIDTGPVVAFQERTPLTFKAPGGLDDAALYRALYSFYDPLLRAGLLRSLVESSGGRPASIPAREQLAGSGTTFHFMHPALKRRALARLFTA